MEWLNEFDSMMKKERRHILLFLDNAPVHPQDLQLDNIKLKFFPANTTSRIQPLDQGIIRTFKAHYRRYLVKHIIANANRAMTADDIKITALDTVYWVESAWHAVTQVTILNTFRSAGFERSSVFNGVDVTQMALTTSDSINMEEKSMEELDRVLEHLAIGGQTMSALEYVVRFQKKSFERCAV